MGVAAAAPQVVLISPPPLRAVVPRIRGVVHPVVAVAAISFVSITTIGHVEATSVISGPVRPWFASLVTNPVIGTKIVTRTDPKIFSRLSSRAMNTFDRAFYFQIMFKLS